MQLVGATGKKYVLNFNKNLEKLLQKLLCYHTHHIASFQRALKVAPYSFSSVSTDKYT